MNESSSLRVEHDVELDHESASLRVEHEYTTLNFTIQF